MLTGSQGISVKFLRHLREYEKNIIENEDVRHSNLNKTNKQGLIPWNKKVFNATLINITWAFRRYK